VLPTDVIVADKFAPDANTQVVDVTAIPDGWMVSRGGRESVRKPARSAASCSLLAR